MTKPKVLILGKLPPPYMGPAIATQIILNSSLKNRYELLHVDTRASKSLQEIGQWSIRKIFANIKIYFRLLGMIIRKRPNLVLIPISQSTTGFAKDFFFIAISRLTFRKVLLHLRGSNFRVWLESTSAPVRFWVKSTLKWTQGVIVLGNNLRPLFSGIFPDKRIYIVSNGGNYNLTFTVKRNNPVQILYLGNLQRSKGIEDVLQAVLLLKGKNTVPFTVDVIGEWRSEETRMACTTLIIHNELPVVVHPPEVGDKKLEFMTKADIFIFTPRAPEGHPWVLVEALAAGLPVIATDKGAILESVRNGENGFIVGTQNPGEIAEKLEVLISDAVLRERMGRASRKLYEANFTEEIMVENLSATFDSVMNF